MKTREFIKNYLGVLIFIISTCQVLTERIYEKFMNEDEDGTINSNLLIS